MTVVTELANTAVTPGTYGSSSQIPVFTVDEDGRLTAASNTAVAGVDSTDWYSANNTFAIETGDGSTFNTIISDFDLNVNFGAGIDVTGNVTGNITSKMHRWYGSSLKRRNPSDPFSQRVTAYPSERN
mgnify:CR=1 FL=1